MENRAGTVSDPPIRRSLGRLFLDTVSEGVLNVAFFLLQFVGWGIRWTIATVFFLAVMAGAGYYVFMQALSGGQHVQVPNIVGMDLGNASMILAGQGLELGKPIPVAHDSVAANYVLAQRPAADRVVRTGRKVHPTISMGAEYLKAPNLLMKDWRAAEEEILQSQFVLGRVARIPHASQRDTVIGQYPPPGSTIENQGSVNLLLSAGDESSISFMPNIIGMTEEKVRETLQGFDVTLEAVEVSREDVPTNVVLSQEPLGDQYVYPGTIVRYEISRSDEEEPPKLYKADVGYTAPPDGQDHLVVVRVWDRNGNAVKIKDGSGTLTETPSFNVPSGATLTVPVEYAEQAKVEFTDNGQPAARWQLKEGGSPVLYPQ